MASSLSWIFNTKFSMIFMEIYPILESATMAALPLAMAEVYDANSHLITGGELRALQPIFKIYGRRQVFTGPIVTLKVFEDNVVVREFLGEKG
ncbi:hypothetical protein ZWY2020_026485 [Hordeum vulgare]|nr:hypothetical protein ZWY2020_026485 [Hordeum vulgare]